jgi:hypothetical protein
MDRSTRSGRQVSDQPPSSVADLIAKWRTVDAICRCSVHCDCLAQGYEFCADELEALLGRLPVPQVSSSYYAQIVKNLRAVVNEPPDDRARSSWLDEANGCLDVIERAAGVSLPVPREAKVDYQYTSRFQDELGWRVPVVPPQEPEK